MRFFRHKGKQHLEITGDFIMTKNADLITCSSKSAAPVLVSGGLYAYVRKGNKLRATLAAIKFIWGK